MTCLVDWLYSEDFSYKILLLELRAVRVARGNDREPIFIKKKLRIFGIVASLRLGEIGLDLDF